MVGRARDAEAIDTARLAAFPKEKKLFSVYSLASRDFERRAYRIESRRDKISINGENDV